MSTAEAVTVLLDRIESHIAAKNNLRAGCDTALAAREAMTADRDACAKAAANAQAEASKLRAKLEEVEAASLKHHTRALEAESKIDAYHTSLTAHRAELKTRKNARLPALPPTYDDDSIPF